MSLQRYEQKLTRSDIKIKTLSTFQSDQRRKHLIKAARWFLHVFISAARQGDKEEKRKERRKDRRKDRRKEGRKEGRRKRGRK